MLTRTSLAGALLVLSALFAFAAPFIPSHADFDASSDGADIAAFFQGDLALQSLQGWLHPFGAGLLLAGLLAVYPRLHSTEGPHRGLAPMVLVAGGAFLAVTVVGFAVAMGAIRAANEGFDPHLALFAYNAGWSIMVFTGAYIAPFLVIPFGLLARGAGLARWFAAVSITLGAAIAAIAIAGLAAAAQPAAFLGLVLFLVWTLLAGVALLAIGRHAHDAPAAA